MVKEQLINAIAMKLAAVLNEAATVQKIKDVLVIELYNYDVSEITETSLVVPEESSTEKLLQYFAIGKLGSNKSEKTIDQYRRAVYQMCYMVKKDLSEITAEDVQYYLVMYRQMYKVKASTMENRRLYLSSVFSYLYKHKKIKENPMVMIEPISYRKCVKVPLSDEEIERIRVACSSRRDIAIVEFFLGTGVRVSELCGINIEDVDFMRNRCKILGKGNKERFVYFSGKCKVRLQEYLQKRSDLKWIGSGWCCSAGTPLFCSEDKNCARMHKSGVTLIVNKLADRANVQRLHCHLFRATYATNLFKRGVDINIIARALGHANLNTIQRYVLLTEEQMDIELARAGAA